MTAQHTAAPWIAEDRCTGKSPDAGCGVIASDVERKISNPSRGIAAWATRHVGQTSAEVEANARLISAAPDLLIAAKAALHYSKKSGSSLPVTVLDMVREAILKATGEQP